MYTNEIITSLFGLIIGIIVGKLVFTNKIYVGPNSLDIVKKTFVDENNKKYKLKPKIVVCPINFQNKMH